MTHKGEWGYIPYEFDKEKFSARCKELLARQPASYSAVSSDCGFDPHTISVIISRGTCSLENAARLAYRLGVSLDYLVSLTDEEESESQVLQRAAEILETTPERLWQLYGAEVF